MSDFLSRKYVFQNGALIKAVEWNDELTQLYQFFSGIMSGKVSIRSAFGNSTGLNDFNGICLTVRNKASLTPQGNHLELKSNGISKIKVISGNQLQSLVTDIAPFDVNSSTLNTNLNAQYLDGLQLSSFFTSGKIVENYISFYFDGIPTTATEVFRFITPSGTSMSIRGWLVASSKRAGYPSNEAQANLDLKKNGVGIDGLVLQQPNFSTSNLALNVGLVENDIVSIHISLNDGTEKCRNISAKVVFRQTLTS